MQSNFDWKTVSLTGGEPLLYKDFDELVKRISKNRGLMTVISNGVLLDKHFDTVDLLTRVNVSLHSLNPEKYDEITQTKGNLQRVVSNVNHIKVNSPHIDVRLNVVLTKGFNDSLEDMKRLLNFADFNRCSIKFIELANDKDKIVTLQEIQQMLESFGIKKNADYKRKIVMSDNITLTRTTCEQAQRSLNIPLTCKEMQDFVVTPSGTVNMCVQTNEQSSIMPEIKARDDKRLVDKLMLINDEFGKNCKFCEDKSK